MSSRKQITCINQQDGYNPHERIKNIGGVTAGERWKYSQAEAIAFTERGVYSFYLKLGKFIIDVSVATHMGNKYLKTQPDAAEIEILLSLPECPPFL
jgi:hypothetical protein